MAATSGNHPARSFTTFRSPALANVSAGARKLTLGFAPLANGGDDRLRPIAVILLLREKAIVKGLRYDQSRGIEATG